MIQQITTASQTPLSENKKPKVSSFDFSSIKGNWKWKFATSKNWREATIDRSGNIVIIDSNQKSLIGSKSKLEIINGRIFSKSPRWGIAEYVLLKTEFLNTLSRK